MDLSWYKGKRIFVTGHTGFKGSYLCKVLINAGAKVSGYSLNPPTEPSVYKLCEIEKSMNSVIGDIRDFESLKKAFDEANPEIVFHLAAQPLVIDSYKRPAYTYETNVMGTVNILECVRAHADTVKSVLNVTTDKVYFNDERGEGFSEDLPLDGFDPYSNSKSCSELVTHSYKRSFLDEAGVAVSTARAGNVIGGGDFAENRIIPDCVRAAKNGETIGIRNPYSIRPYQHVLDPIFAYLMIAAKQYENIGFADYYNVGPDDLDCVSTGQLADIFCKYYEGIKWENKSVEGPHEANFLKLDCRKLKRTFGWQPVWNIDRAIEKTVEFSKAWIANQDVNEIIDKQILEFMNDISVIKCK